MKDSRLPEFPIVVPIEVMFRDIDAMGHMNNAVYLSYLEWARSKYWMALEKAPDFRESGFVIARMEIDYLSPAEICEMLLVGIRIPEAGTKSFVFEYRMVAAEPSGGLRQVARARSVQVLYSWDRRQSIAMTPELRSMIEALEGHPL